MILLHFKGGDNQFFHYSFLVQLYFMYFLNDQSLIFQENINTLERGRTVKKARFMSRLVKKYYSPFQGGDKL